MKQVIINLLLGMKYDEASKLLLEVQDEIRKMAVIKYEVEQR